MKELSLEEFEKNYDIEITFCDTFLKIDNKKIDYESIINHRFLGMNDHIYSSNTKALGNLLLENWDFVIQEIEDAIKEYEVQNEN